jgi:hypothetical protein
VLGPQNGQPLVAEVLAPLILDLSNACQIGRSTLVSDRRTRPVSVIGSGRGAGVGGFLEQNLV